MCQYTDTPGVSPRKLASCQEIGGGVEFGYGEERDLDN